MPFDNPTPEGNFYILGKLTNWKLDKANRMTYNYKRFGYECNLVLKQGYYNYIYAFLKDKSKAGDETLVKAITGKLKTIILFTSTTERGELIMISSLG